MKLLLFDVDGTLLLTGGAGVRAMERAGVLVCGQRFSLDSVVVAGGMDPYIFAEAAARAGIENVDELHETFYATYLRELPMELEAGRAGIEVMPGIMPLLETLRCRDDVSLGLLTGNYRQATPIKLRAAGFDPAWFAVGVFGDDASNRPALARLAMQQFEVMYSQSITGEDTIVIGDTPRDVACAQANACRSLAVATGRYSVLQLQDAGADVVVENLLDPQPLWDMLDGQSSGSHLF